MKEEIEKPEFLFPQDQVLNPELSVQWREGGATVNDLFAGLAMIGLLMAPASIANGMEGAAENAWKMSDRMMKLRRARVTVPK